MSEREVGRKPDAIVAGCDVGSTTGKAVVLGGGRVTARVAMPCKPRPEETGRAVLEKAARAAGLRSPDAICYLVGTGYGRIKIPFAEDNVSEITCHARGASFVLDGVRTAIDIGGQDCKVIRINERGRVAEFAMNEKCAAGTGRFFEAMSRVLHVTLEEMSVPSLKSERPTTITSQCSVFAESEVITQLNEGEDLANIACGINLAIARRLAGLARRVGVVPRVVVTGGCAKNLGLGATLESALGVRIDPLPVAPQIIGALCAAVLAAERVNGGPPNPAL